MKRTLILVMLIVGFVVFGLAGCDIWDAIEDASKDLGLTEEFGSDSTLAKEADELNDNENAIKKLAEGTYCLIYEELQGTDVNDLFDWLLDFTSNEEVDEIPLEDIIGKCDVSKNVNGEDFSYVVYFYEEDTIEAEAKVKIYKTACEASLVGGTWTDNTNPE